MKPCFHVSIVTPKKVLLDGLWLGTRKPKSVVVWVHGLGSSLWSKLAIAELLARRDTGVLAFNNRGHDLMSYARRAEGTRGKKLPRMLAGGAHEVFAHCVDDIDGAVAFAAAQGAKKIFLAGHSTGCQKSVFWASRRKGKGVAGIILIAPISDYSAERFLSGEKALRRAERAARALVARGAPHQLLPASAWPRPVDAQRFISLYTANSAEEIFPYAQPRRNPRALKAARLPLLVLLAERDEYADRPATEIAAWFEKHVPDIECSVIRGSEHSFKGYENEVAQRIADFLSRTSKR